MEISIGACRENSGINCLGGALEGEGLEVQAVEVVEADGGVIVTIGIRVPRWWKKGYL
jgi:hypothetical protein